MIFFISLFLTFLRAECPVDSQTSLEAFSDQQKLIDHICKVSDDSSYDLNTFLKDNFKNIALKQLQDSSDNQKCIFTPQKDASCENPLFSQKEIFEINKKINEEKELLQNLINPKGQCFSEKFDQILQKNLTALNKREREFETCLEKKFKRICRKAEKCMKKCVPSIDMTKEQASSLIAQKDKTKREAMLFDFTYQNQHKVPIKCNQLNENLADYQCANYYDILATLSQDDLDILQSQKSEIESCSTKSLKISLPKISNEVKKSWDESSNDSWKKIDKLKAKICQTFIASKKTDLSAQELENLLNDNLLGLSEIEKYAFRKTFNDSKSLMKAEKLEKVELDVDKIAETPTQKRAITSSSITSRNLSPKANTTQYQQAMQENNEMLNEMNKGYQRNIEQLAGGLDQVTDSLGNYLDKTIEKREARRRAAQKSKQVTGRSSQNKYKRTKAPKSATIPTNKVAASNTNNFLGDAISIGDAQQEYDDIPTTDEFEAPTTTSTPTKTRPSRSVASVKPKSTKSGMSSIAASPLNTSVYSSGKSGEQLSGVSLELTEGGALNEYSDLSQIAPESLEKLLTKIQTDLVDKDAFILELKDQYNQQVSLKVIKKNGKYVVENTGKNKDIDTYSKFSSLFSKYLNSPIEEVKDELLASFDKRYNQISIDGL